MAYTKDFDFPPKEELIVPEVKLGTASLIAAANHLGLYCQNQNDEFMLCRREEKDPRRCLKEGREVTSCSIEFFSKIKTHCLSEFERYANCIDQGSRDFDVTKCRNTQVVFDGCVMEHLNLERASFGYFCKPRVLDSARPKPVGYQPPDFKNLPQTATPTEGGRDEATHGVRYFGLQ